MPFRPSGLRLSLTTSTSTMPAHDRPRRARAQRVFDSPASVTSESPIPRRTTVRLSTSPADDVSPQSTSHVPSPPIEDPSLSPRSKQRMAAALWARRRVLDESLPSKEKFALPRGFGQAGLRFDAKGLQSRAKILRQLLHLTSTRARARKRSRFGRRLFKRSKPRSTTRRAARQPHRTRRTLRTQIPMRLPQSRLRLSKSCLRAASSALVLRFGCVSAC